MKTNRKFNLQHYNSNPKKYRKIFCENADAGGKHMKEHLKI